MTAPHLEHTAQLASLPPIIITEQDYENLIRYADRRSMDMPRVTRFLEQEFKRAELISKPQGAARCGD